MTAVGTLTTDYFGQSFQGNGNPPPLALQHLAAEIDANNVLNVGSVVGFVVNSVGTFTPVGSNLATATTLTTQISALNAAASTTGVALPLSTAAGVIGSPQLMLNQGTAAIHVYGQGGDTIDGTAGTTGVSLTNAHRCFFTAIASGTYVSGPEGGVTS